MGYAPNLFQVIEDFLLTNVVQYDWDGCNKASEDGPENVVAGGRGLDDDSHEIRWIIVYYKWVKTVY